ncbi:MAG: helix-turn-helix transcriptional regulator [Verrucomicrobia bacterium]|jgi:AraC-like DNA-binding protein|nr:helix-turn-helix transcriptional regulator [Verrucomicrobiota bacterium]
MRKFFHHHLDGLPRVMPIRQRVDRLGYLPNKTNWMRYESTRIVFCFILRGNGRLHCGNRWYDIEAPCILTHWPGVFEKYGPAPEGAAWEELFMGYDLSLTPMFDSWGIRPAQKPVWPIASVHTVRRLADELIDYAQNIEERGVADRIDRICQRLILESVLGQPARPETAYDAVLDRVRDRLQVNLSLALDTAALARECGMAEVTFRRYWKRRFGLPIKHDQINIRMQEACRLLVNTKQEIKEIAEQTGFQDARYFSHRFSTLIGMPATEYRHRFIRRVDKSPSLTVARASSPARRAGRGRRKGRLQHGC